MRRLILDGGLPEDLAAELRARGRDAVSVAELGLEAATDAEVLAADGVLVTTAPIKGAIVVSGNLRDVVHRHAHEFAARRR
jgi:predicted nuclease of predicted toxin-antitoxin system